MAYFLRSNLLDSDMAPFCIAIDESATLVQWGRLALADLDGKSLAKMIDVLVDRTEEVRKEIADAEKTAPQSAQAIPVFRLLQSG